MGNKIITINPDEIIKEGSLIKQSRYLSKLRERWVILTTNYLYTFKQKDVHRNPTEQISVESIISINDDNSDSELIFVR